MIEESREEEAYNSLPLKAKLIIRLMVYLLNILYSVLKPYKMSPAFAIYDISEEEEKKPNPLSLVEDDTIQ